MNREDIENILIRFTDITGYDHSQKSNLAFKAATGEIERLLADEQERARKAVLNEITGGRTVVNLGHIPEVNRALYWIVEDIRQLDLTKDLAPSTEGKGGDK